MANSLNLNWSKRSVKMLGLWKEEKWTNQGTTPRARPRNNFKLCWHTRKEKWSRPFVTEVRIGMTAHVSNRHLTALFLFSIIYSKGQSHDLAHGHIMTYSFKFPLVTNHHMRTDNSLVFHILGQRTTTIKAKILELKIVSGNWPKACSLQKLVCSYTWFGQYKKQLK